MPDDDTDETTIRQIDAQIQYHFKINPAELSDVEWAEKHHNLTWVLIEEQKRNPL